MEANVTIKSFRTEGKKIKDLQFNGDMTIDIGGTEGTTLRKALKGLPDGVEITLNGNYMIVINNSTSLLVVQPIYRSDYTFTGAMNTYNKFPITQLRTGNRVSVSLPNDSYGYGEKFLYLCLTQNTQIVGWVKFAVKNGNYYIEGV